MAVRKGTRVDAYINNVDFDLLKHIMTRNNLSLSEIVREALHDYIEYKDPKLLEETVSAQELRPGYYIKL